MVEMFRPGEPSNGLDEQKVLVHVAQWYGSEVPHEIVDERAMR